VANGLHARGAVILLVEELFFFEEKFGSQAEIEAAPFGTSPVSAEPPSRQTAVLQALAEFN